MSFHQSVHFKIHWISRASFSFFLVSVLISSLEKVYWTGIRVPTLWEFGPPLYNAPIFFGPDKCYRAPDPPFPFPFSLIDHRSLFLVRSRYVCVPELPFPLFDWTSPFREWKSWIQRLFHRRIHNTWMTVRYMIIEWDPMFPGMLSDSTSIFFSETWVCTALNPPLHFLVLPLALLSHSIRPWLQIHADPRKSHDHTKINPIRSCLPHLWKLQAHRWDFIILINGTWLFIWDWLLLQY